MSEKAMTITYDVKNGVYVNMTNRCNCRCEFCLRFHAPGVYGSDPLWLEREPTVEEVIASLQSHDLANKNEVVFCGYGEPTERLYDLLEVAKWVKENTNLPTRINTNGLANLLYGENVAPLLKDKIDVVSISLNSIDAKEYNNVCHPEYGLESYEAMLRFTEECAKYVPTVMMTVVDQVTTPEEQAKAKEIAEAHGAKLRVRPYED